LAEEIETVEPTDEEIFGQAFDEDEATDSDTPTEEANSTTKEIVPAEELANDTTEETETTEDEDPPDFEALFNQEKQKNASWDGRIKAANERAAEAEKQLQQSQQIQQDSNPFKEETDDNSDSEDDVLAEFVDEFPELETPLNLLIEKKTRSLIEEQLKTLTPAVQQLTESAKKSEAESHYKKITSAHPDWSTTLSSGRLDGWIDKQPFIIRNTYKGIIKAGSTDEVIELLTIFKQTNQQETKQAKTQKAKNLIAVRSGPASTGGTYKGASDPNDFEAAWDEFD